MGKGGRRGEKGGEQREIWGGGTRGEEGEGVLPHLWLDACHTRGGGMERGDGGVQTEQRVRRHPAEAKLAQSGSGSSDDLVERAGDGRGRRAGGEGVGEEGMRWGEEGRSAEIDVKS